MQLAQLPQSAPSVLTGPVILIVDDDPDVCALVAAVLSEQAAVIAASDGYEAVQKAIDCRPALILCDSEMPGLRGHEVIHALANNRAVAKIPVILTSGYAKADAVRDCEPAAFLQKPFTLTELTSVVREMLATAYP